jgi:copper chaperone CopZ
MINHYTITGMTCAACKAKIEYLINGISGVSFTEAIIDTGEVIVESQAALSSFQIADVLKPYPKYQLVHNSDKSALKLVEPSSFFQTYKPILILFTYLLIIAGFSGYYWGFMTGMQAFMGGFFLAFSFFKMLDLPAFANSYAMYDIIAMRWNKWGYVYAIIEFILGLAFVFSWYPIATNLITLVVMGVSLPGVVISVVQKKKIQCACLGTVFNLPMSTLTIVEDSIMILMSMVMLIFLF